jgi:hypothetical protein
LFDPASSTLADTPISVYGMAEGATRPMTAALLGLSLPSVTRAIRLGELAASGDVQLRVPLREIEALRGRPISVHDWLSALVKARTMTPRKTRSTSPRTAP